MASDSEEKPRVKRMKISNPALAEDDASEVDEDDELDVDDEQPEKLSIYPADFFTIPDRNPSAETLVETIMAKQATNKAALSELPIDPSTEILRRDLKTSSLLPVVKKSKVGFLGCPGHGKSSLINALVGVPDFLPADSSGDSCTATPTSIEFNDDSEFAFHAIIEYISREEWRKEVQSVLDAFKEAQESNEDVDLSNPAVTKFRAVYPNLINIPLLGVEEVLASNDVGKLLGTTPHIKDNDPKAFRKTLHDSIMSVLVGRTTTADQVQCSAEEWTTMPSNWPIIQNITIRVRSLLLKDGLTLMDIPGIKDSNRAKSARAEEAINKCDALVVVSEAARVLSNRDFGEHLDMALKLVHYSGHVDRVMLVSTKSDNFEVAEERRRLKHPGLQGLENNLHQAMNALRRVEKLIIKYENQIEAHSSMVEKHGLNERRYKRLQTKCNRGETVYAPVTGDDGKLIKSEPGGPPLKIGDIKNKLNEIKQERKDANAVIEEIEENLEKQNTKLLTLKEQTDARQAEIARFVFRARNANIKRHQADAFIEQVKQRDEQLADLAREQKIDLDAESENSISIAHNYAKLRQELAIFCVSARAFQGLTGGKVKAARHIIEHVEDTEMMDLARCLFKVAADAQYDNLQKVNNEVHAAYESLKLHLEEDAVSQPVDEAAAQRALKEADAILKTIPAECKDILTQTFGRCIKRYQSIVEKLPTIKKAVAARSETDLDQYRLRKDAINKLRFVELKATIRRKGVWTLGRRKLNINFNRLVKDCIDSTLSIVMHRLFVSKDDAASCQVSLKSCLTSLNQIFNNLKASIGQCNTSAGVSAGAILKLEEQHRRRKQSLLAAIDQAIRQIEASHVVAGAGLVDEIEEVLSPVYFEAYEVTGVGATQAMMDMLCNAILNHNVLHMPMHAFMNRIQKRIETVRDELLTQIQELAESMVSDYRRALSQRDGFSKCNQNPAFARVRQRLTLGDAVFGEGLRGIKSEAEQNNGGTLRASTTQRLEAVKREESETDEENGDVPMASGDEGDVKGYIWNSSE